MNSSKRNIQRKCDGNCLMLRCYIMLFCLICSVHLLSAYCDDTLIELPVVQGSPMMADYIKHLSSSLDIRYQRDFKSKEEFEQHKQKSVQKLRKALGLYPWPERHALNPRIVGKLEREDYVVEKLIFESHPGYYINATVFLPKNVSFPVPAIVNPLGHWVDKYEEEVQLRCIQLARKGFIALTYDPVGHGERTWLAADIRVPHEDFRRLTLMSGHSMAGMMFWDTMRCIDYLFTRDDVDKNRIGCVGLSGGGFNTLYTTILDERIKVSVPTVYATNLDRLIQGTVERGSSGCCAYLPHHATYGEIDDMYALIAPRPLLILAGGEKDRTLSGGAMKNYQVASKAYKLYGMERLNVFVDESAGHTISKPMREKMYLWFNKWLKGDDDPEHARENTIPALFNRDKKELDVFTDNMDRGKTIFDVNKELLMQWQGEWFSPRKRSEIPRLQSSLRKKLLELLGDVARCSVRGEVKETKIRTLPPVSGEANSTQVFSIENILLTTEPGITLHASLYIPQGNPAAGMVIYLRTDEEASYLPTLSESINQFLKSNYAVFFVRVRGTWETNYKIENESGFDERSVELYALALGKNIFGTRVFDLMQSINYIKTRDNLKNLRITCVAEGLREGLLATYTATIDNRISTLITNGGLTSYRYFVDNSFFPSHEYFVPHILRYADTPEMLAALSPRKVYIINSSGIFMDKHGDRWQEGHPLPRALVDSTFQKTKQMYRLSGSPDAFEILSGNISYMHILGK